MRHESLRFQLYFKTVYMVGCIQVTANIISRLLRVDKNSQKSVQQFLWVDDAEENTLSTHTDRQTARLHHVCGEGTNIIRIHLRK